MDSRSSPDFSIVLSPKSTRAGTESPYQTRKHTQRQPAQPVVEVSSEDEVPGADDHPSDEDYTGDEPDVVQVDLGGPRPTKATGGKASTTKSTKRTRRRPDLNYDQYYEKIDQQNSTVLRLRQELRKKADMLKDTKNRRIQQLNVALTKRKDDNKDLKDRLASMETELKTRMDELKAAALRNSEIDTKVAEMQEERLELMGRKGITATPDSELTGIFAKIFREIRDWSKKWTVNDWVSLSTGDTQRVIQVLLSEMPHRSFCSPELVEAVRKGKLPPRLLVNAMTNGVLFGHTVTRPFETLRINHKGLENDTATDKFSWIYDRIRNESREEAERLRASVWRAVVVGLEQEHHKAGSRQNRPAIQDLVHAHVVHLQELTLLNAATILKPCDTDTTALRASELSSIISRMMDACIQLHPQPQRLYVGFRHNFRNLTFSLDDESFVGHRNLKLKEEGDTQGEDAEQAGIAGRPIDLVIEPLIERHGDEHGKNMDRESIISKAVVWMVKPEVLKDIPPTPVPHQTEQVADAPKRGKKEHDDVQQHLMRSPASNKNQPRTAEMYVGEQARYPPGHATQDTRRQLDSDRTRGKLAPDGAREHPPRLSKTPQSGSKRANDDGRTSSAKKARTATTEASTTQSIKSAPKLDLPKDAETPESWPSDSLSPEAQTVIKKEDDERTDLSAQPGVRSTKDASKDPSKIPNIDTKSPRKQGKPSKPRDEDPGCLTPPLNRATPQPDASALNREGY